MVTGVFVKKVLDYSGAFCYTDYNYCVVIILLVVRRHITNY